MQNLANTSTLTYYTDFYTHPRHLVGGKSVTIAAAHGQLIISLCNIEILTNFGRLVTKPNKLLNWYFIIVFFQNFWFLLSWQVTVSFKLFLNLVCNHWLTCSQSNVIGYDHNYFLELSACYRADNFLRLSMKPNLVLKVLKQVYNPWNKAILNQVW